jgi:hypothetical protein
MNEMLFKTLVEEFQRKSHVLDTIGVPTLYRPQYFKRLLLIQRYDPSWMRHMEWHCSLGGWDPNVIIIESFNCMEQAFMRTPPPSAIPTIPSTPSSPADSLFSYDEYMEVRRRLTFD